MKKWLNLENLIYLSIFLLPTYLIKIKIFALPTNALEIIILLVLIWGCLQTGFKIRLKTEFKWAIGLIFIGVISATILNKNYLSGLGIIKAWFILPLLFSLFIQQGIPQERRKNVLVAYFFSAVAVGSLGIIYYFLGETTFDGRLQGIFNSPNYLAMYLVPGIIIGSWYLKEKNKIYWLTITILSWALFLTFSYAAWLALILALLSSEIVKNKYRLNLRKISIFIGIIGLLTLLQMNNQKFKNLQIMQPRSSLQSRIMIWQASGKILADNWVWGIGPGNFQSKYLEYQKYFPPYLEWAVPHPHNLYLSFYLTGGILGLSGFLALIFFGGREFFRRPAERPQYQLVAATVVVYILLHGLADTTYFKNDLAIVFWLNFWLSSD